MTDGFVVPTPQRGKLGGWKNYRLVAKSDKSVILTTLPITIIGKRLRSVPCCDAFRSIGGIQVGDVQVGCEITDFPLQVPPRP